MVLTTTILTITVLTITILIITILIITILTNTVQCMMALLRRLAERAQNILGSGRIDG